jgi:hypothetical protein
MSAIPSLSESESRRDAGIAKRVFLTQTGSRGGAQITSLRQLTVEASPFSSGTNDYLLDISLALFAQSAPEGARHVGVVVGPNALIGIGWEKRPKF